MLVIYPHAETARRTSHLEELLHQRARPWPTRKPLEHGRPPPSSCYRLFRRAPPVRHSRARAEPLPVVERELEDAARPRCPGSSLAARTFSARWPVGRSLINPLPLPPEAPPSSNNTLDRVGGLEPAEESWVEPQAAEPLPRACKEHAAR